MVSLNMSNRVDCVDSKKSSLSTAPKESAWSLAAMAASPSPTPLRADGSDQLDPPLVGIKPHSNRLELPNRFLTDRPPIKHNVTAKQTVSGRMPTRRWTVSAAQSSSLSQWLATKCQTHRTIHTTANATDCE